MPVRTAPDVDPITAALAPSPGETVAEREERISKEQAARDVSSQIDDELEKQRVADKKMPKPVKVLLLGQSESGKSTTLKNFQLMCEPHVFRTERASWRAVIQLNVVRSIHLILDAMSRVPTDTDPRPMSPSHPSNDLPRLTPDLYKLKMRLSPLLQVEEVLTCRLIPSGAGDFNSVLSKSANVPYIERSKKIIKEVAVNSTTQWKGAFNRRLSRESFNSETVIDWDDPKDPGVVLHACSEDMIRLWNDPIIQELLDKLNLRMEELAGFFLDSLERVTSPKYVPSDDDILRARLKTLGVSEHHFKMYGGNSISRDWRVFDVGGHRSQVGLFLRKILRFYHARWAHKTITAAWAPYFDDMDAIIFLAPISCFDQVLAEDTKVNRLEDSYNLWLSIVSNPLLKHTNLILFLNKIDIMKAKLAAGTRLSRYVVSYGDRPNDFENTSAYLRKKFAGILRENSPLPRVFYCHLTAVTDTKSTTLILSNIKDMLMRQNLEKASLLV